MKVKELDKIKTKDGRIGTVMLVLTAQDNSIGLEVEFDNTAPRTETIDITDVIEIIEDAK